MASFISEYPDGNVYNAYSPIVVKYIRYDYQTNLKYIVGGKVEITISYDGPTLNSYSIEFPNYSVKSDYINFNLSDYIRANFIDGEFDQVLKVVINNVYIYYTDNNGSSVVSSNEEGGLTFYATKGYSFLSSNKINEVVPVFDSNSINRYMKNGTTQKVVILDKKYLNVGTTAERTEKVEVINGGSTTTLEQSAAGSPPLESNAWRYLTVTKSDTDIKFNHYEDTTLLESVIAKKYESMFEPIKLEYINKQGALNYLWFNGNIKKSTNFERQTFKRGYESSILTSLNNDLGETIQLNIDASNKFTLNSGFVDDVFFEQLKEIMFSEVLFLTYDLTPVLDGSGCVTSYTGGTTETVKMSSSSIERKKNREGQVNYTIELESSSTLINNRI